LFLFFKGELGKLQIYFRKITQHQQKFLVVSVLSNAPWLPKNLKNVQNEISMLFSIGNTFRQATMQAWIFVSFARWHELALWLNQDPNMNKMAIILKPLMELLHC